MRYLLDTTFLIDHIRGDAGALALLPQLWAEAEALYVNEVVICEYFTGLRDADVQTGERLVAPLDFIQPAPDHAKLAARWRREVRATGRTLSVDDALIAVAAHSVDAAILTRNVRDFALAPVKVETY